MLVFNVIWAKSDPSFLTEWTLFLNIYMLFAWIFICRLHRDYKKVSTKISFSHQFATILMDQLRLVKGRFYIYFVYSISSPTSI